MKMFFLGQNNMLICQGMEQDNISYISTTNTPEDIEP